MCEARTEYRYVLMRTKINSTQTPGWLLSREFHVQFEGILDVPVYSRDTSFCQESNLIVIDDRHMSGNQSIGDQSHAIEIRKRSAFVIGLVATHRRTITYGSSE